jgi:CheY-like chemotaxis protein
MLKHGGSISTMLKPRAGAVFVLHFPLTEKAPPPPKPAGATPGTGRILVMEDDAPVAQVLTRMLVHLGYRAEAVDRGEAALDAYARARGAGDAYDAVILDLTIREGLGGLETLVRLKALAPEAKALVSSGYANAPIMAEFEANGFHGVLVKPYRLEDVSAALRRVLA